MSEQHQQSQQPEQGDERSERPEPDQHDPDTEQDTASGGPAQPPDHRD
ncbi:MAG TPA: hypothetical protein VFM87_05520 [Agrococcus sp.]|nr:hypothetical protein [Agrococcus sp.]